MKKRLLALFLALAMAGSMVPVTAFADDPAGPSSAQQTAVPMNGLPEGTPAGATAAPEGESLAGTPAPAAPTADPTDEPIAAPTAEPTAAPTADSTDEPTDAPEAAPAAAPTPETDADPTATPEAAETPEPTDAAALALADEPAPLALGSEPLKVRYREKDLPFYEFGGSTLVTGSDLMYIVLPTEEMKTNWGTYTYEVTAPGEEAATTIQAESLHRASAGEVVYWSYQPEKNGQYTVRVRSAGKTIAKGTVILVKVTFHAGEKFQFEEGDPATYVGWFEQPKFATDAYLNRCNVPALEKKSGQDFIGWSTKQAPDDLDAYTNQELIPNGSLYEALKKAIPGYSYGNPDHTTLNVYAAYGVLQTLGFTYTDEDGTGAENKDIVLGSAKAGYPDPNIYAKTYRLKNTGTRTITITPMQGTSFAKVEFKKEDGSSANPKGGAFKIPGKTTYTMVITPNPGLGVGKHGGSVYYLFRVKEMSWNCGNKIEFNVNRNTLLVRLKEGESVTKVYGKSMTAADIRDKIEAVYADTQTPYEGITDGADALDALDALGITLDSEGFKSNADVGTYAIASLTTSTDNGMTVNCDSGLKMEVTRDTPKPQTLSATAIHVGSALSASKLTGSFVNSNDPSMAVTGVLAWDENPGFSSAAEGEIAAAWTFTPDAQYEKNYTSTAGQVMVTVSQKAQTTLSPAPENEYTVTYDKKPHTLRYTADRIGDDTPIVIRYKDGEGNEVVEPTKAGAYNVEVHIEENEEYAPATLTTTLTIEPKVLSSFMANSAPDAKRYDGTTELTGSGIGGVRITAGIEAGDDVKVQSYAAQFESADANPQARVKVTVLELGGTDAGNYKLSADPICHTYAGIYLQKLTITKKDFTKKYGEPLDLSALDFVITTWDNRKISGEDADLTFVSNGMQADATVGGGRGEGGKYVIGALLGNKNYTFGNDQSNPVQTTEDCGTITVERATPVVNGALSVGAGHKGCELDHVALGGGFVNGNNPDMPVTGTLQWKNENVTLPKDQETYEAEWIFKPSDTTNYTDSVEGKVTIRLLDQEPVHVTVEGETEAVYNGAAHGVGSGLTVTLDPAGSSCTVEYSHHGVGDWKPEAPVDAGTYDVRITAFPPAGRDDYAANQITTQLTITPARPESTAPGTMEVPEGTALNSKEVLDAFAGCFTFNGETVQGSVAWAVESGTVTADGEVFEWIFTPDSRNFETISGIMKFMLKDDSRQVTAEVYNLPAALSYRDYAVITNIGTGPDDIRPGDTVTFFKDADCKDPVSSTVPVTAEDAGKGRLTVLLDGDALAPEAGGSLYARINTNPGNAVSELTYYAEPGFTLEDDGGGTSASILVCRGATTTVTAKLVNEGAPYRYLVDYTLSNADGIVEQTGLLDGQCMLRGVGAGSGAMLTVTVTVFHPDPYGTPDTITFTTTVPVVCTGMLEAKAESGAGAPAVALGSKAGDELVMSNANDREALANGDTVTYALTVTDADASAAQADRDKVAAQAQSDGGYTVGCYFDIEITRLVNNVADTDKVTRTASPLTLTITIPADLLAEARAAVGTPEFVVYRLHDGTATRLTDLDGAPGTVTIQTDLFSLYALAYTKAKTSPPPQDPDPQEPAANGAHGIPHTGDTAALRLWWWMLVLCSMGLAATVLLSRRRGRR